MQEMDFLNTIVDHKKQLNQERKAYYDSLKSRIGPASNERYHLFKKQISREGQINLIAEIKKASPSKGMLREDFDPLAIASVYAQNGAAAISVLTEEKYFLGKPSYVKKVSEQVNVPILTKDFIIDEGQIFEARYNGASAILLIVAILEDQQIQDLMEAAHRLDLDCLVEVHDASELDRALSLDVEIIGINNRNLHTFEVSMSTCADLIPKIPRNKVIVAESGITTHGDIQMLQDLGAHAVLIGETFMREDDVAHKVQEIMKGNES